MTRDPRREFRRIDWIRRLEGEPDRRRFPIGIGDDAAAWRVSPGHVAVASVDAQVAGVHFERGWLRPREIGRRAVAVGVSDLAAMGARPRCLLLSLTLEAQASDAVFRRLQEGILAEAAACGARVIGGNLSVGAFALHVTALGEARAARLLRRDGARAGDELWVSGSPGLATLGLRYLAHASGGGRTPAGLGAAVRAFRAPTARTVLGGELAAKSIARAAIDVSDGLAADLGHLLRESSRASGAELGAELDASSIAALPRLQRAAAALGVDPLAAALGGGEDYELLFSVRPGAFARHAARWAERLEVPLTRVGRLRAGGGIVLFGGGADAAAASRASVLPGLGWDHFAASR